MEERGCLAGEGMEKFKSKEPVFLCRGSSPMAPCISLSIGHEPALPWLEREESSGPTAPCRTPSMAAWGSCVGDTDGGERDFFFVDAPARSFSSPLFFSFCKGTTWNMGSEQTYQRLSFFFRKNSMCVAGNLPKLPRLEVDPGRTWAFGNEVPKKIPPQPTGLQLVQQSKDLTYCKDYLHFQITQAAISTSFERKSAVTVGQQRYKLPNRSAALSLPGESCPAIEKLPQSNKSGRMAKNLRCEAQGSEERFQIPAHCKRSTHHYCLIYYLMQIYREENGGTRQWFNSSFQRVLPFTSHITQLYLQHTAVPTRLSLPEVGRFSSCVKVKVSPWCWKIDHKIYNWQLRWQGMGGFKVLQGFLIWRDENEITAPFKLM